MIILKILVGFGRFTSHQRFKHEDYDGWVDMSNTNNIKTPDIIVT